MFFKKEIITNGRVVILDEPLAEKERKAVHDLETVDGQEIILLEDAQLAAWLEKILEPLAALPNTLFVFPGNGANFPRRLSQVCRIQFGVGVHAKRFWIPGENPEAQVGLVCPERFMVLGIKNVVIVDDVISSGLTIRKLYQTNSWRIPGVCWHACAWISQILPKEKVRGYHEISVACLVKKFTGDGKVPVNSLSTLRQNTEIATSYAHRHFRTPEKFLQLIK